MILPPSEAEENNIEDFFDVSINRNKSIKTKRTDEYDSENLCAPDRINETVDQVNGIKFSEFAKLKKKSNITPMMMKTEKIAVIAMWRLNECKVFECYHFFLVPNPMKRTIKEVEGTELN